MCESSLILPCTILHYRPQFPPSSYTLSTTTTILHNTNEMTNSLCRKGHLLAILRTRSENRAAGREEIPAEDATVKSAHKEIKEGTNKRREERNAQKLAAAEATKGDGNENGEEVGEGSGKQDERKKVGKKAGKDLEKTAEKRPAAEAEARKTKRVKMMHESEEQAGKEVEKPANKKAKQKAGKQVVGKAAPTTAKTDDDETEKKKIDKKAGKQAEKSVGKKVDTKAKKAVEKETEQPNLFSLFSATHPIHSLATAFN